MRAFRITFDESTSKFVIEIQGFAGLYWKKAKVTEFRGEKDEFRVTKHFDTYQKARDYVKDIGLDQIYEDFTLQKPYGSPGTVSGIGGMRPVGPENVFTSHDYSKPIGPKAEPGSIRWTVPYAKEHAA
jgi:hypothetical protein